MARNIEIKAHVSNLATVRAKALAVASGPATFIEQSDTFFVVPQGRLNVREISDGTGELISYERPNESGPKESVYTRISCQDAKVLGQALGKVLPVRGVVVTRREVFMVGRTRIHLVQVHGLGSFVELEVVLRDDESTEVGGREARRLLEALEISSAVLIPDAYIDLLEHCGVSIDGNMRSAVEVDSSGLQPATAGAIMSRLG